MRYKRVRRATSRHLTENDELLHALERRKVRCGHRQTVGRRPVMPIVIRGCRQRKIVTPRGWFA